MIRPKPIEMKKIWGRELWLASVHRDGRQEDFAAAAGDDFPLIVKIIEADDRLSVQVHPDDETARRLEGEGAVGKTECWLVLGARPGARLVHGLSAGCGADELSEAVRAGRPGPLLNVVEVKAGDFLHIPAGTVHAIGGGLRLLEVQQSCNTTYRLFDWNRGREIHVEKSLEAARLVPPPKISALGDDGFSCPHFSLRRRKAEGRTEIAGEGWRLLFFISSDEGTAVRAGGREEKAAADSLVAVAPGEAAEIVGNADFVEILPPKTAGLR